MHNLPKQLFVAGFELNLDEIPKRELKGLIVDDVVRFSFFKASIVGNHFVLVASKAGSNETPLRCSKMAERMKTVLGDSIVFYFNKLEYYERMRYIEKQVYFISGDDNAFLPNMMLTSKPKEKKQAVKLSAASQYLLLSHLQGESMEGRSVSEVAENVPYSYVSVAKAIEVMEDLGLCECEKDRDRNKRVHFVDVGERLWAKAKPFMTSPVKERMFCDSFMDSGFLSSGITALSKYSMLAKDDDETISVYSKDFKEESFMGLNKFDGPVTVEIWRYPLLTGSVDTVDKLSLYLSLEDNNDPRVEKENELMLEGIWQTA